MMASGLLAMTMIPFSCNKIPKEEAQGTLLWNFGEMISTRSLTDLPDTDDFILEVLDANGNRLYNGRYGDSPSSMMVDPGSYTVNVRSIDFSVPLFDAPQFGDNQVVVVNSGAVTKVRLTCTQLNSGLRLLFSDSFRAEYSGGEVVLAASEGSLSYSLAESRIAYFKPGSVTGTLVHDGGNLQLMTRNLDPAEILTISISCPSGGGDEPGASGADLSIVVDTNRVWNSEDYIIGQKDSAAGHSQATAYSVPQAREHIGEEGVWVKGYIVGGDLSSKADGISFSAPFESKTNLAIASRSSVRTKSSCLSVQLSKSTVREELNLVDNPELLGKKIYVKGKIVESYFGINGIQNITEYSIKP